MAARNRTRQGLFGAGWKERKITSNPPVRTDNAQTSISQSKKYEICDDVIGSPGVDHTFGLTVRDDSGWSPLLGHLDQGGGSYVTYNNWLPSGHDLVTHHSITAPTVAARALTLRSRTNPSREEVSLPNFIHELKDLPGMYRDIMGFKTRLNNFVRGNRGGARTAANYNLSVQMGFLPLISDIRKLLQFQELVDRRIVELEKLYSNRGLKRRMRVFSQVESSSSTATIETSLGISLTVKKFKVTKDESWGTIRWIPTAIPKSLSRPDLGRTARRLVLGVQHRGVDAVQAWNALPWSWLIDWFANVDDFLGAHRNVIPAEPTGACNIMRRQDTYETWFRTDGYKDIIKGAEGVRRLTGKSRVQSSGSLSVTLPFMSKRQLSILGALAIQRLPR